MDDTLIYVETFDKLIKLILEVVKILTYNNLTINFNKKKCQLSFQRIRYLGQLIEEGKMKSNAKREEILRKLRSLENITELQGLI